jgi:hypothetical protein
MPAARTSRTARRSSCARRRAAAGFADLRPICVSPARGGLPALAARFLARAKRESKTVAAYGAAAKGNTLLNFCGATPADIAMVADRNPHKQSKLLPGTHIPVVSPEELMRARPDYVLILPWNLQERDPAAARRHQGVGRPLRHPGPGGASIRDLHQTPLRALTRST